MEMNSVIVFSNPSFKSQFRMKDAKGCGSEFPSSFFCLIFKIGIKLFFHKSLEKKLLGFLKKTFQKWIFDTTIKPIFLNLLERNVFKFFLNSKQNRLTMSLWFEPTFLKEKKTNLLNKVVILCSENYKIDFPFSKLIKFLREIISKFCFK